MTPSLIFKDEAREEILDTAKWYREKQVGLDQKFLSAIAEASKHILKHPGAGRKIYRSFRQTLLRKFPYVLVYEYEIDPVSIIIYAIFHTSRSPKRKLQQLKK